MNLASECIIGTRKFTFALEAGDYYVGVRNLDECSLKTPHKKIECHLLIEYPSGLSEERMSEKLTCMRGVMPIT